MARTPESTIQTQLLCSFGLTTAKCNKSRAFTLQLFTCSYGICFHIFVFLMMLLLSFEVSKKLRNMPQLSTVVASLWFCSEIPLGNAPSLRILTYLLTFSPGSYKIHSVTTSSFGTSSLALSAVTNTYNSGRLTRR